VHRILNVVAAYLIEEYLLFERLNIHSCIVSLYCDYTEFFLWPIVMVLAFTKIYGGLG
jgi:hypothetical protein